MYGSMKKFKKKKNFKRSFSRVGDWKFWHWFYLLFSALLTTHFEVSVITKVIIVKIVVILISWFGDYKT